MAVVPQTSGPVWPSPLATLSQAGVATICWNEAHTAPRGRNLGPCGALAWAAPGTPLAGDGPIATGM